MTERELRQCACIPYGQGEYSSDHQEGCPAKRESQLSRRTGAVPHSNDDCRSGNCYFECSCQCHWAAPTERTR